MLQLFCLAALPAFFQTSPRPEILALRQQVAVLNVSVLDPIEPARPDLRDCRRYWSRWAEVLLIVKPETVIGWFSRFFLMDLQFAEFQGLAQIEDLLY